MSLRSLTSLTFRNLLAFMGYSHNGERDLLKAFGYARNLRVEHLEALYQRGDIAHRIIKAFPKETWRDRPVIRDEAGDNSEDSEFVKAWEVFEREHKVFSYFERADRLAGIGRYAVLLCGFRDGQNLDQPLTAGKRELLFLQPYGERNAEISKWVTSEKEERFGLPLLYTLQQSQEQLGQAAATKSLSAHYSRVVHIVEDPDENDSLGTPRLLAPYNRLKDLEKVAGSSAETFWLNARPGLGLFADKEANISDEEIERMETQAEEFQHQLRRIMVGQGITPTQLAAAIADPKPNAEMLLQLIAGTVGIPMRILVGSERGELASSQDENSWSARIDERREQHATPNIIQPFVELMIATGNLPKPQGEWTTEWPERPTPPKEEAEIGEIKARAVAAYANSPDARFVVAPEEFRPMIGLEPDSEHLDFEELEELEEEEEIGEPGTGGPAEIPPKPEPAKKPEAA